MFKKFIVMLLGSITVAGISAKAHEVKEPIPVAQQAVQSPANVAAVYQEIVAKVTSEARKPATQCIDSYLFLRTYSNSTQEFQYSQVFNKTRAVRCKSKP